MLKYSHDADFQPIIEILGVSKKPLLVSVQKKKGFKPLNCFPNVQRYISSSGGRMILGWKLHKGDLLLEAEWHAIVETPKGFLIDITPSNERVITFIPVESAIYDGSYRDNIRVNRHNHVVVEDFIKLAETHTRFLNIGDRETQFGKLVFNEVDAFKYRTLSVLKSAIEQFALVSPREQALCFCGNQIKYSECHSNHISKLIDLVLNPTTTMEEMKDFVKQYGS